MIQQKFTGWLHPLLHRLNGGTPRRLTPQSAGTDGAKEEGGATRFLLEAIRPRLRPGWYMIELGLQSDGGRGVARFSFDFGAGFSDEASVSLAFASRRVCKRLCCLTASPRAVRLELPAAAGDFTVEHLRFARVPGFFAHNRMLQRLRFHLGRYHDFSPAAIWCELKHQARLEGVPASELLQKRYGETFKETPAQNPGIYADWIAAVEAPELADAEAIRQAQGTLSLRPVVSVVMPTWNTPEPFLRRAIESVLRQSYPHWQLCVADDASTAPHVRAVLEEYAARDERIRLVFRERNGHISAASNSALALADGDWVTLLDHDDELAEHALHFMVQAIAAQPEARVLYSDEDKIDAEGRRCDPLFKPDWNPDLFFSQNYVAHLTLYRRALLASVGGFRTGVEGSQDQDLLLRCLPHLGAGEIVHVPRVLYHWRTHSGSTALAAEEKSYTTDAGLKALRDHFTVQGAAGVTVEAGLLPNTYRVRHLLPDPAPLVSLLIPTRDRVELLETCVSSILEKTSYPNYEILILDNGSTEPATLAFLERIQAADARVRVLAWPHPFNFSAINNFGVRHARGSLVGLINNDIEAIGPGWLTEMASHAVRPEIGCVGAKLHYADGAIQHAGVILGIGGVAGHSHKYFAGHEPGYFGRLKLVQNLSAVTGACLVVRKAVYEAVGGLDEENLKVAFNDVDFCLKVRDAGWRNLWTPYAELYHHESKSRGAEDTPAKQARFQTEVEFMLGKWGSALVADPMYSPHLSRVREDFSLRIPG